MTPEQMQMFQLQNIPQPVVNIPGQVVQAGDPMVESTEVDVVSEGLALTVQSIARNGPTHPIHRGRARTMTKSQLEEQKMNEATGLPSNAEEASRVVALENMVSNLNDNMGKVATILTKMAGGQPPKVEQGPPPTPPERPVAEPLDSSAPNGTLAAVLNPPAPTCLPPGPQMVPTIPVPPLPVSPPAISPMDSLQPASQETAQPIEPTFPGPDYDFDLIESKEASPDEPDKLLIEIPEDQTNPVVLKELERLQILTDQTAEWLRSKDPHKFWRQFIAGACNKNLSYNTWPKEFQAAFDKRFQQMVHDPIFITNLCGRIKRFQNGHLIAPHVAGAFITVMAGFLSFALLET